jgi:beta-alanine--pyruvate transaminase
MPGVLDIRTVGLTAAIDLASRPDAFGRRAYDAMERAFHDENLMIRSLGETLVLTPPLVIAEAQVAEIFEKLGRLIRATA